MKVKNLSHYKFLTKSKEVSLPTSTLKSSKYSQDKVNKIIIKFLDRPT